VERRCASGEQCGGCAFFAPFDYDWGLCSHPEALNALTGEQDT
jgi:hypothetical protein